MTDKFYLFKSAKEARQFAGDHVEPVGCVVDPEKITGGLSPGEQGAAAGRKLGAALNQLGDLRDFNNAGAKVEKNFRGLMSAVTESIMSEAEKNGIPRSILKMSFLTGYPYNTKKWHRLQYHLNRLYKDFPKNSRKIKKYIRLINKMDQSLSGRVMRIDRYNIRIRQEKFRPVQEKMIEEMMTEAITTGEFSLGSALNIPLNPDYAESRLKTWSTLTP